jgi:hypothetical protein
VINVNQIISRRASIEFLRHSFRYAHPGAAAGEPRPGSATGNDAAIAVDGGGSSL